MQRSPPLEDPLVRQAPSATNTTHRMIAGHSSLNHCKKGKHLRCKSICVLEAWNLVIDPNNAKDAKRARCVQSDTPHPCMLTSDVNHESRYNQVDRQRVLRPACLTSTMADVETKARWLFPYSSRTDIGLYPITNDLRMRYLIRSQTLHLW